MLCSISQAGFASEPWNALKTNFQHGLPTWKTPSARADGERCCICTLPSTLREVPEHFAKVRQAEPKAHSAHTCGQFSRHPPPHLLLLKLVNHLRCPEEPKHFRSQGTLVSKKLLSLGTNLQAGCEVDITVPFHRWKQ